jgi:carbon-monoxide dehydrogenase small subunit
MSLDAFLRRTPDPGEEEIREALAGNLCRCTGYAAMVVAVRSAAHDLHNDKD